MRQWMVLFKKEWIEMTRNFKILWIPLVFILLGIMQPVTSYYLPEIIKAAGELPEGAVFEMPIPSPQEVIVQTFGQYTQIGILVLVLAFMGIVAAEKNSGVSDIILVKPVSFANYITAKWVSIVFMTVGSFLLGILASWYYTGVLIGDIGFGELIKGSLVYGTWLVFLVTVTLLLSSLFKSNLIVAFVSLLVAIGLSAITSLLSKWMTWSPARLSTHASKLLLTGSPDKHFALSLTISILLIVILLIGSIYLFAKKERAA
ncbi:ABC transporter permease subunit [Fredinandcohnia sp. QZ13]|uniref:ABC transporter permease n=1 Tax=Fredinandcohnia sp. QZ13 TaxID=3073144 RepID=UPI0028533441|nr:ABC transporter permease subunit [Fredinandcohnia sp. QZ13]MDR4890185.1 ABC transporter permease subunit [Fredinandcohnia sp. QZ13]